MGSDPSKKLWDSCQEKRKQTFAKKGQNNRTKRFYLLRDLMYCGHCGSHMAGRINEKKNEYLYYCPRKERDWAKSAPKGKEKWKRNTSCTMTRSLNIQRTDALVQKEFFKLVFGRTRIDNLIKQHTEEYIKNSSSGDEAAEIKKLQNKKKRLVKELNGITQNIADVETAKILGKQLPKVADKILENLASVHRETENKISGCKIKLNEIKNKDQITEAYRTLNYNPQYIEISPQSIKKGHQNIINRIDVSYDKDLSEHTLTIHFKIPLDDGSKSKTLNLKKNKKAR